MILHWLSSWQMELLMKLFYVLLGNFGKLQSLITLLVRNTLANNACSLPEIVSNRFDHGNLMIPMVGSWNRLGLETGS